uniref:Uncharacterized protein n=1 Tax=Physcomitrium patens TaxID=3218 RepID=A0A2K1J8A5_PHYPA|nr:hypothetical protein PHYPA_020863 [Physcomitrium patens]
MERSSPTIGGGESRMMLVESPDIQINVLVPFAGQVKLVASQDHLFCASAVGRLDRAFGSPHEQVRRAVLIISSSWTRFQFCHRIPDPVRMKLVNCTRFCWLASYSILAHCFVVAFVNY